MSRTLLLEAVYEDGVIKPLEQVDLPEHAHLKVELTLLSEYTASLRGLWKGLGDLGEEDFEAAEHLWEHDLEKQLKILKGSSK